MSATGARVAQAARTYVGVKFRLHGREPETGLDCVGLVQTCLTVAESTLQLPSRYGLQTLDVTPLLDIANDRSILTVNGPVEAGDILLVKPSVTQHHLLVALNRKSFVHAHAGLRRVVETPFPAPWPILRHWRLD